MQVQAVDHCAPARVTADWKKGLVLVQCKAVADVKESGCRSQKQYAVSRFRASAQKRCGHGQAQLHVLWRSTSVDGL